MAIDSRFWREKETLNSAQDPSWFFAHAVKPVQQTTANEVPGETALKELAAEATANKEELETSFRELNEQEEEAKREASVLSSGPLVTPASHEGGLDSSKDPNWFFDELVRPLQHTAEKESPGEEAHTLLAKGQEKRKAEEQAAKDARQHEARALVEKGVILGSLNQVEEEIGVYEEVIRRFGQIEELELREQVAQALVNKGVALGTLGRTEEVIEICDEAVILFQEAEELELREQVAKALVNKGVALGALGRFVDTIKICDEVVTRFQEVEELELQEQLALALVNKGVALGSLDRREEATAVYDEVVTRFEGEVVLLPQVDRALQLRAEKQKPKDGPKSAAT